MSAVILRFQRRPRRRRPRHPQRLTLGAKLQRIAAVSPRSLESFDHMADIVLARLEADQRMMSS